MELEGIYSYSKLWDFQKALTQNDFSTLNLCTIVFQNSFHYVEHGLSSQRVLRFVKGLPFQHGWI